MSEGSESLKKLNAVSDEDVQRLAEEAAKNRPDLKIETNPAKRAEYVRRLQQNCVRYLKATSPELLKPYKSWLSETGNFLDVETGKEMGKKPQTFIKDASAFAMIERATFVEMGRPDPRPKAKD